MKSVFITIAGKPNVGKSSLLNSFLGTKIAIVTPKPQTTRTKIIGILTEGEVQYVFTDTPGFHKAKNKLGEHMNNAVSESLSGTDVILFVTDPFGKMNDEEINLINKFKAEKTPVILCINKIDLLKDKTVLLPYITYMSDLFEFSAVVPISVKKKTGLDDLKKEIVKFANNDVHYFDDDALTDQNEYMLVSEIIREKILLYTDKEVPHGIAVSVEKMRRREDKEILDIDAIIYCEKENHSSIIIGKGGEMIKRISTSARIEIQKLFEVNVNLKIWVKVKENWRNREGLIHNFDLD